MARFERCVLCARKRKVITIQSGREVRHIIHPHAPFRPQWPGPWIRKYHGEAGDPCCIGHSIIPFDKPDGYASDPNAMTNEDREAYEAWRRKTKEQ